MTLLPTLLAFIARRPASPPPAPTPAEASPAAEERSWGCGWFDSSHELQSGLLVQEHAASDALAAELPLPHWLALQLGGWRADAPT